jgi:hypothetical protein
MLKTNFNASSSPESTDALDKDAEKQAEPASQ